MYREPRTDELGILYCTIKVKWNDGLEEDLSPDLPEYIVEQIEQYLDELEDLRNQAPQEYNVSEVNKWN